MGDEDKDKKGKEDITLKIVHTTEAQPKVETKKDEEKTVAKEEKGKEDGLTLAGVRDYLEANKGNEEIVQFLAGFNPLAMLTPETVGEIVETMPLLKSHRDTVVTKGIETWKENNLDKEYTQRYSTEHPDETEGEKRIRALEVKQQESELKGRRAELKLAAHKALIGKGIKGPALDLIDHFIGESEEQTLAAVEAYANVFAENDKETVKRLNDGFLKKYGREIAESTGESAAVSDEETMSDDESMEAYARKLQEEVAQL